MGEKIFVNHILDKGLISRLYKESLPFNNNTKQQAKNLNTCYFKEEIDINGHQAYEKMLSVTNYQRNVNQNNNQISPHTFQDAYCQKKEKTENNKHW